MDREWLGGDYLNYFSVFSPRIFWGKMIQFDVYIYFSDGFWFNH